MKKKTVKQVKKKRKKKNTFMKNIRKRIAYIKKKMIKYKHNKNNSKKRKKKVEKDNEELKLLSYKEYKGFEKVNVFFKNRKMVISDDMKKFKKKLKYGTLKDKVLIIIMLCLVLMFSLGIIFCVYIIATAPEISEKRLYKSNATVLYDKNGNEVKRLGLENREKVSYEELPQVLVDAIVATEDSRFFQHNGIDIARFTKAVFGQLLGRSDAGGGSTLTMQVSKNAATNSKSHGIKGIVRKFTDIYLSVFVFEKQYTKEQIIEFYVNIPNLGSGTYGVEQASKTYFGKSVSELNLGEAAMIAGLFQAPSAYNPYVNPKNAEARRNTVLNLMCRHGYITEEERDAVKSVPVESMLIGKSNSLNKYVGFIDTVVEEVIARTKTKANPDGDDPYTTSMKIWTTLDPEKQDVINDLYDGNTKYKWKNDVAQAGIAVVSVEDGSIVAVGAGRNKKTERSLNYATTARHHPGSTAKPVLDYGPAFEYLNWSPGQTIIDDDYTYSGGGQIKNFDNKHKGIMTAKTALAQSRNIPALFAFQQTTNEQKLEFATNLGWKPETSSGTILETCSIGGFDGVTPLEAAAAYATFARGGTYIEPFSVTKIEYTETGDVVKVTPKKVTAMSEESAYMINTILKYAVTSGVIGAGSVSGTDIAAKTGTSTVDSAVKKELGNKNIIGDSWEIAYSPDYAIATWYGYPERTKDHYLTSSEGGAARREITKVLVSKIMKKNSRFNRPNGIVEAEIELGTDPIELASEDTPSELRSVELFKKGFVPTTTSVRFAKLSNPSNLKFTNNNGVVTLTWDSAPVPDAINENYLREYFNNSSVYKTWADKYLQERINYNNNTFGSFGYHVYMVVNGVTTDLGFTTSNTFSTNINANANVSFVVKSSYQKFTNNQSSGVTINVASAATTNPLNITYKGSSCTTIQEFNSLGTSPKNKIKVLNNNEDVTEKSVISYTCKNETGTDVDCSSLTNGVNYSITFKAKYNGLEGSKTISIKSTCN